MYQGRGRPLMNLEEVANVMTEMTAINYMIKIGHMGKANLMIRVIRILEAEETLEITEIEVTEEILAIERGHMAVREAEIEILGKALKEIEVGRIQYPEVEEDQPLGIIVKREGVSIAENQDSL